MNQSNNNINDFNTDRLHISNGVLVYSQENATKRCMCTYNERYPELIGKKYSFTEKCEKCNGTGKIPGIRGGKKINKKCPDCEGNSYITLEKPIIFGNCPECDGKKYHSNVNTCDNITKKDISLLYDLIDFENMRKSENSTFNEEYLGFGIVGGVTDYGRYLKMSPEEYKEEVKSNFINGYHQYVAFLNKNKDVCKSIKINKTSSGWFLYPCF
jgi:RecJ-like exonuclease